MKITHAKNPWEKIVETKNFKYAENLKFTHEKFEGQVDLNNEFYKYMNKCKSYPCKNRIS